MAGWWSDTYGHWRPAWAITYGTDDGGPSGFDWTPDGMPPRDGPAYSVTFRARGARLEVDVSGDHHTAEVTLG